MRFYSFTKNKNKKVEIEAAKSWEKYKNKILKAGRGGERGKK